MRKMKVIGSFFCFALVWHLVSFDGVLRPIWVWFCDGDDAVFANEYTWHGFWRVRIGDSESRVLKLIGEPIMILNSRGDVIKVESYGEDPALRVCRVYPESDVLWRYSVPEPKGCYTLRSIRLDETGHVIGKNTEFYVD